jgi:hypothetical protein
MKVFPNPVSEACHVTFTLDQPGFVQISLVSLSGIKIATWLDRKLEQGKHSFSFSSASLATGLYQVVLQQGNKKSVKKIIRVE